VAHLASVFVVGVTLVKGYEARRVKMKPRLVS